jgi:hypothetical protein
VRGVRRRQLHVRGVRRGAQERRCTGCVRGVRRGQHHVRGVRRGAAQRCGGGRLRGVRRRRKELRKQLHHRGPGGRLCTSRLRAPPLSAPRFCSLLPFPSRLSLLYLSCHSLIVVASDLFVSLYYNRPATIFLFPPLSRVRNSHLGPICPPSSVPPHSSPPPPPPARPPAIYLLVRLSPSRSSPPASPRRLTSRRCWSGASPSTLT